MSLVFLLCNKGMITVRISILGLWIDSAEVTSAKVEKTVTNFKVREERNRE
jgi:hypothetical protein